MIVVSNASPLIILSGINQLEILKKIFQSVLISQEVYEEVTKGYGLPGAMEVAASPFIKVKHISTDISDIQDLHRIGKGEAATIILAQELEAELVLMDDKRARDAAKACNLCLIGTLGLLELGFKKGIIPDLRRAYHDLLQSKARITPQLINQSLAKYGLESL